MRKPQPAWRFKKPDFSQLSAKTIALAFRRFFTEGWYFGKEDVKSRDRFRLVMCNYTSNVIANLIGGSFLTGLLLLMNADDGFIGTITMISTAANMLQLFAPLLLERFSRRKKLLIILRSLVYLFNVAVIGITPLFPLAQQTKLLLVALWVLVVNVLSASSAPGISIWHIQSIPNNVRQSYFTIITMTVGAVVAVCNLAGSTIVDLCKAQGNEYAGLLILRAVAMALVGAELWLYSRIREYPYESSGERIHIRDMLVKPLSNRLYLRTVLVCCLWNFSANTPGSYYTVYMLKNVEVSYSYLTLISMLNVPVVLLLTPLWKRVLQKLDWFRTLAVAMLLYGLCYIGLAFTTRNTLFLYPIAQLWAFIIGIGINLSFTGIPYLNMPEKGQTIFIGFYSTCANLAALLGVTVGKYFILWTDKLVLHPFGFEMVNKQYLVLLTSALVILSSLGVFWADRSVKKKTGAQG